MPCLQLHWIYPSCFEKSRHGTHPGHLHQLKRTGGESWFQAISGTGSAWIVCCCIWRYFHEMRLPDASIRGRSRHDRPGSPEMDRGREEIRIGRLSFPPEIQKTLQRDHS